MTRFRETKGRPSKRERAQANCAHSSTEAAAQRDLDIRLDLALGKPEDVSAYADCIRAARHAHVTAAISAPECRYGESFCGDTGCETHGVGGGP